MLRLYDMWESILQARDIGKCDLKDIPDKWYWKQELIKIYGFYIKVRQG